MSHRHHWFFTGLAFLSAMLGADAASPAGSATASAPAGLAGSETQSLTPEQMAGIVLINGDQGVATGFLTTFQGAVCVVTNLHVLGENQNLSIKTLQGEVLRVEGISGAVGADIALLQVAGSALPPPFVLADNVLQSAKIGDQIVVVGNRLGGGVATQTSGKILGIGPERLEVNAAFQHGNSGSPIYDLRSKQVLGVAAYADTMAVEILGNAGLRRETRWFGYRLDTVAKWERIDWNRWRAQSKRVADFRAASLAMTALLGGQLADAEAADSRLRDILTSVAAVPARTGSTTTAQANQSALSAAQAAELLRAARDYATEGVQEFAKGDFYDYFRTEPYWESSVPEQVKFRAQLIAALDGLGHDIPSYLARLNEPPSASPALALTTVAGGLEATAPVPWAVTAGGNGHYFQAVAAPKGINWDAAQAWALARGGHLASIGSAAENRFVFNLVADAKYWYNYGTQSLGPWLGGVKTPAETRPAEGWQWLNNEVAFSYTNWAPGQPNNGLGGEDRINFIGEGLNSIQPTWSDTGHLKTMHGFVVEYPDGFSNNPGVTQNFSSESLRSAPSAPAPLEPGAVTPWDFGVGGNGHSYQAVFAASGIIWDDAQAWAVAHGGNLASLTSAAENDFVFNLVRDRRFWPTGPAGNFLIGPWLGGFHVPVSASSAGGWRWIDSKQSFAYTHWVVGQPDGPASNTYNLHFMAKVGTGPQPTWDDQPGNYPRVTGFVVEYTNGFADSTGPASDSEFIRAPSAPATWPAALAAGPVVTWPFSAGGTGHFYQAVSVPTGINWADSQAWAVAHGGYLATLTSAAENLFVFNLSAEPKYWYPISGSDHGPWIGAVKSPGVTKPAEGWEWLNYEGALVFTAWAPGQPNNDQTRGEREDRIGFIANGASNRQPTWSDAYGGLFTHGFVVEYDREPPQTSSAPTGGVTGR